MQKAVFLVLVGCAATASADAVQPLTAPWQYHWGDFPPPVSGQSPPGDGWLAISALHLPPGQSADHILWLRLPLPAGEWRDPAVLLSSVTGAFEAYAGNRLVGRDGVIRPEGTETADVASWHLLELNPDETGHELLLRLQSSAPNIGVAVGAFIGTKADLTSQLLMAGFGSLAVALLLVFTGLVALVVWAPRRTDSALLTLACFALVSAAIVVGLSEATPLLVSTRHPIALVQTEALCLFSPVFIWTLLTALPALGNRSTQLLLRGLIGFCGLGAFMVLFELPGTRQYLNLVLIGVLGTLIAGVVLCVREALAGSTEARILAVGFASLFVAGAWDSLPLVGVGEARGVVTPWGFLGVVVAFVVVNARRASLVTDTLSARTRHLEERQSEVTAFSQRLDASARDLAAVVDALRRASDAQAQGANRQAASVHETQVTADEIRRTSALAAEKAGRVLEAAIEAEAAGKTGAEAVDQSLRALEEIGTEVAEMTRRIAAAGTRTREIAGIVASVKDLAAQSNMLALNAAIEAVRSGEAGRGFAVVAREVRRLADESLSATARIKEVLDGLGEAIAGAVAMSETGGKRVAVGLATVRASGEQLQRLSGIVQQTSGHVRQISSAVTQQNAGVAQITAAIDELSAQMQATLERARDGETIATQVQDVVASMRSPADAPAPASRAA